MKQRLSRVTLQELTTQSAQVVAHVLTSSWYKQANTVSCYLSTPTGEINTDAIIIDALTQGKALFVPFCPIQDPTVMKMLRLKNLDHFKNLQLNRWSIRELNPSEVDTLDDAETELVGGLDLILIPGMAFDKTKKRLGHGRGYYDRYINRAHNTYRSRFNKPPPLSVALALEAQLVDPEKEQIPWEEFDRKPDKLVLPSGVLE
ncbi:hypothetical protein OIO90_004443 [Microbotryomycetes sp. JL221]|nr:hypothetical protein OIO90_004443 [Microbotryomycetes sp. JL221]